MDSLKNVGELKKQLGFVINKYGVDNALDTPSFILAEYLLSCLINYKWAKEANDSWHHKTPEEAIRGAI
jgi:hypothetical protein